MVILVFHDHDVQNRVIHTQRTYTRRELELAGQYISELCLHQDLMQARQKILVEMKLQHSKFEAMLASVVKVAEEQSDQEHQRDFIVQGEANLFGAVPGQDIDQLKKLFEAFNEKQDLLHLLDQSMQAQDVKIFVGEESGYDVLDGYSVVTAPYHANGKVVGVLGVVGPRRMQYDQVMTTVDITAKLLSNAFDFKQEDVAH